MEAGFGERLKHLDEGYNGLADKVVGHSQSQTVEVKKEIENEEEKLKKLQADRNKLIRELAEKAKLRENEKEDFIKKINYKDKQLSHLKSEIEFLSNRLNRPDGINPKLSFDDNIPVAVHPLVSNYAVNNVLDKLGRTDIVTGDDDLVKRRFKHIKPELFRGFLKDMCRLGYLDQNEELTSDGIRWLQNIAKESTSELHQDW